MSTAIRAAALDAALDELQQWGVDRFSLEGTAHRAQLNPEVLRQNWGSERQLIIDALLHYSRTAAEIPDTGSLRDDLCELTLVVANYLNEPVGRRICRMMVVDSKSYEADIEIRTRFWAIRQETVDVIFRRAAARGELRDDAKPILAMQLLTAPLHIVALYSDDPVTAQYCRAVADSVARAVTRAQPTSGERRAVELPR